MADKTEARFYVSWNLNPVHFASCGWLYDAKATNPIEHHLGRKPDGWKWLTRAEFDAVADSSEPSKVIAEWLGLPYQKYLDPDPGSQPNVVEMVSGGDDCAWDQPCRFGHRVEGHAVYCHNSRWIDSPRKCHRRQKDSAWGKAWPHEECPGFEPNPRVAAPAGPPKENET